MIVCEAESCNKEAKVEGLCYQHYKRLRRLGTTELITRKCDIEGCEEKHLAKGLCKTHYFANRNKIDNEKLNKKLIYKDGKWKIQDELDYVPIIR